MVIQEMHLPDCQIKLNKVPGNTQPLSVPLPTFSTVLIECHCSFHSCAAKQNKALFPWILPQEASFVAMGFMASMFMLSNIQKKKIMTSSHITSWQIDGETMETVTDFIFLGSKITEMMTAVMKLKKRLLLGRKTMTNLDSILKSRDITLPKKVCLVKAMVFPE